jgi:hypothetical protein
LALAAHIFPLSSSLFPVFNRTFNACDNGFSHFKSSHGPQVIVWRSNGAFKRFDLAMIAYAHGYLW